MQSSAAMMAALAGYPVTSLGAQPPGPVENSPPDSVTLFLAGDVMTGRGIDQILPHPSDPVIHERYMKSAQGYVELAERLSGPIPRKVSFDYIWGDALEVLDSVAPDFRIINLETSVTTHDQPWPGKGITYRMHPGNIPVLAAAGIDCCALANNHVLDWCRPGLEETLDSLSAAGISYAGAGRNQEQAARPARFPMAGGGNLLVYSCASSNAGIPRDWAAKEDRSGVSHVGWLDPLLTRAVEDRIRAEKQPGDVVVVSVHWGSNWEYEVPRDQRTSARRLIHAGADLVHGHSSHHVKGIEVYQGKPVIYGAGDLINDYEGISDRYEEFRGELELMYFVTLDRSSGGLRRMRLQPMRIHKFRLQHASPSESDWLFEMLNREGEPLNTAVRRADSQFELEWR